MWKIIKTQRGGVAVFTAAGMIALLGFAALAIDLGYMASTKTELQTAADQAALAGVQYLTPGSPDTTRARSTAIAYAQKGPGRANDTVASPVISLGDNSSTITVTTTRTIPLFFARIFNNSSSTLQASATARISSAGYIPPGAPPFAIVAPDDIVWQGTNNMWSQTYTMEINPSAKDHFTYVDVVFKKPTTIDEYYNLLADGYDHPLTMNSQLYWVAPAEGGKASVDNFASRLTQPGNHDITKAAVGDPNLMMIPLLSTLPTSKTNGSDWSYSTNGLKIVGFVGFWLDNVVKGPLINGRYPYFYATGRFIQIAIPPGSVTVPGGQFFGPQVIQLIK